MTTDHYTYRVTWSQEDSEYLGLCIEFPSLSWVAATPEEALSGIRHVTAGVVTDLRSNGEAVPQALAEKTYSGEFRVRIPQTVHRALAMQAAVGRQPQSTGKCQARRLTRSRCFRRAVPASV